MLSCMGIYLGLTSFGQVVLEMIQTVVGHDIQGGCLSNQELLQIKHGDNPQYIKPGSGSK